MNLLESKTDEIRKAISRFILLESGLRSACVFGLGFWILFLVDFIPIKFGFSEMPLIPRVVGLILLLLAVFICLKKYLLDRLSKNISDENIILLIERQHPEFNDRLLTVSHGSDSVVNNSDSERRSEIISKIEDEIQADLASVDPKNLLARNQLFFNSIICLLPYAAFVAGTILFPKTILKSAERTFFLSPQKYERQTNILEVVVRRAYLDKTISMMLPSTDQQLKVKENTSVAKNSQLQIKVSVQTKRDPNRTLKCSIHYQFEDGRIGTTQLQQLQKSKDGTITYGINEDVFGSIDSNAKFWVRADDATSGPYQLEIVEAPQIVRIDESVHYPAYLLESSFFNYKTGEFVNNSSYPAGTSIEFEIHFAQENLETVQIWQDALPDAEGLIRADVVNNSTARFTANLLEDTNYFIVAKDNKGIVSTTVHKISLDSISDRPPTVNVSPIGIGSAITRNAILRFRVEGEDEFGLKQGNMITTFSFDADSIDNKFDWDVDREKTVVIDLQKWRRNGALNIDEESPSQPRTLSVSVQLSDYNPSHTPSKGQSYEFEIVGEKRLVQLIEREEAGLRKRLEDVYDEFQSIRSLCANSVSTAQSLSTGETAKIVKDAEETIRVFAQQIRLQTQKTARDISGVSNSFLFLIDQLENNRLTVKTKQKELKEKVEGPLRLFAEHELVEFQTMLSRIPLLLDSLSENSTSENKRNLIDQAKIVSKRHNELLETFSRILEEIVKFESQNELLDSIRSLIEEHKKLMEATQKERDQKLFEGILD